MVVLTSSKNFLLAELCIEANIRRPDTRKLMPYDPSLGRPILGKSKRNAYRWEHPRMVSSLPMNLALVTH